ncbi:MAG TPA: ATP-binding protein [Geminicoccaceae bacterium]|nr:ATP-binding protein [Geminicoccaceae bacterium]
MALDRVVAEQRQGCTYPFVPIIADDPDDLAHLPPFAHQYQGMRLTEDGRGLADLVRVAARLDAAQPARLVAQPFMGLEAFEAKDAALFFGRRAETQALVDRLRTTNLVLVTGDSGSGKTSLVKAGLVPAVREGGLADPLGRRPEPGQWHVVEMRPGTDPFEGLVEGAQRAATAAGIEPDMVFALGTAIRTRDPGSIRDALRQSGPPGASLLLVVDQFEELWTLTIDDTKRPDFLAALLVARRERLVPSRPWQASLTSLPRAAGTPGGAGASRTSPPPRAWHRPGSRPRASASPSVSVPPRRSRAC